MLRSPWMLLVVVPLGFLLVAGAAVWQAREWTAAATLFAGLALLAFCVGLPWASMGRTPTAPSRSRIMRFAVHYLHWYPATTEAELRGILRRRFGGAAPTDQPADGACDQAGYWPGYGEGLLWSSLLVAAIVGIRDRFFPTAPAAPADIEAVLTELQARGQLTLASESRSAEQAAPADRPRD